MNAIQRTQIVVEVLGIDRLWAARIADLLNEQNESHGGGDTNFRAVVEVVGKSWIDSLVAKDTEKVAEKASSYIIERISSGEHYMNALVGGFAMSSVYLRFTDAELKYWDEFGDYYLEKIYLDIAKNSDLAAQRTLI